MAQLSFIYRDFGDNADFVAFSQKLEEYKFQNVNLDQSQLMHDAQCTMHVAKELVKAVVGEGQVDQGQYHLQDRQVWREERPRSTQ